MRIKEAKKNSTVLSQMTYDLSEMCKFFQIQKKLEYLFKVFIYFYNSAEIKINSYMYTENK